jgi:hypothetical protein
LISIQLKQEEEDGEQTRNNINIARGVVIYNLLCAVQDFSNQICTGTVPASTV